MSYIRCPTCNRIIGHIQLEYDQKIEELCHNPKLSSDKLNDEKEKLIKSYNLSYCCNMRIMTKPKLIEIIE